MKRVYLSPRSEFAIIEHARKFQQNNVNQWMKTAVKVVDKKQLVSTMT